MSDVIGRVPVADEPVSPSDGPPAGTSVVSVGATLDGAEIVGK